MTLEQLFQAVETRFHNLAHGLLKADSLARLRDKSERWTRELRDRYAILIRQRGTLEGIRHRLAARERRAAQLTARIETYLHVLDQANAWQHALQLDQIQQSIQEDRLELQRQERAYGDELASIEQLKRRLAEVREELCLHEQGLA